MTLKKSGIMGPADLNVKTLGAPVTPDADPSRLLPKPTISPPRTELPGTRRGPRPYRRPRLLLADFPVCLAECEGQRLLCNVLRDLIAYQSKHDAGPSRAQHAPS